MDSPGCDPRNVQIIDPPMVKRCCCCVYCKFFVGIDICVYTIFHAVKLERLATEELVRVGAFDEACDKYKEADAL